MKISMDSKLWKFHNFGKSSLVTETIAYFGSCGAENIMRELNQ